MSSGFETTMSDLGYCIEEQENLKLTFRKERKFSTLVLVIDLGLKYINPILVPKSVIILESDLVKLIEDFKILRNDAKIISDKSKGKLKVLN